MIDGNRLFGKYKATRHGRKPLAGCGHARGSARLCVESLEERALLAVFTVTNTLDAGAGSLRQAILDANALAGPDDIEFAIVGGGPHTIQPTSPLPDISDPVMIDGFTQPGSVANTAAIGSPSDATFQIEIDGMTAGSTNGLTVNADGSSISGLVINRFSLNGIRLNSNDNEVSDNFIGTDVTGQVALGNALDGVLIIDSANNTIQSNLLSGNLRDGVNLLFPDSSNNMIIGNFVGTNRGGDTAIGNLGCGVEVSGGSNNQIDQNLISASGEPGDSTDGHGVRIGSASAMGNTVSNNLIGTDISGTLALGNRLAGVEVQDGSNNSIVTNTIAFNLEDGITITGDAAVNNIISGNSTYQNIGLGIDLADDGVTANDVDDPDLGPNNLMNFPEISDVVVNAGNLEITYSVPSVEPNVGYPLTVQFFVADVDMQEGQTFLATEAYLAPGPTTAVIPIGGLVGGEFIVATAFEAIGNTSEFSAPAMVPLPPDPGDNDTIETATVLGSPTVVTINDDSVGEGDEDYFKYTAHHTGKLIVNALFTDADGDIDLEIVDMSGDLIASSTSIDDNENLVIPVVTQEMYFIHVFSFDDVLNTYDLEIENFAAPVPNAVLLDPASDTGMMNNDNITSDTTPTLLVQADLSGFASMGIDLLDATEANAGTVPGVGVEVTLVNADTGDFATAFASPVGGSGTLWTLTSPILSSGRWLFSAASYVVDGQDPHAAGRTVQSSPTVITIITEATGGTDPQLLESSDTGMLNNDNVTKINEPAFNGTGAPAAKVDLFATNMDTGTTQLVGSTTANGAGLWEITSEPLADGVYDFTVNYTNLAGGVAASTATRVYIDTAQPNTPFLDLVTDSGRSDADNVTNDDTPTLTVTANDTIDGGANPFHHDIKYRIYVRPDGNSSTSEILLVDSFADLGDFTTEGFFTHEISMLPNGVHNFKLEVEDRAGNISEDFLLDVTIDTMAPDKSFGDPGVVGDGLRADSDSGVTGQELTLIDAITNDTTPSFWGFAEANSIVRAFVDTPAGRVQIGQTVAQPFDGNQAFPNGRWELTADINLATLGLGEGLRTIIITAEDVSGNISSEMSLDIFLDTLGPQVTNVTYPDGRSVFGPKPTDGPSPLTSMLIVTYFDSGERFSPFNHTAVNQMLALDPSTYRVVGDHNGVLLIDSVQFISASNVDGGAEYVVQLNMAAPLPDDRISLTIFDSLSDDAGNALDGDLRADEPGIAVNLLPSGDGVPGGDFDARFTMDARPEIGTWAGGSVYVDTNGNFTFDPENADDTNEDIVYTLGFTSDDIFAGNFSNGDNADGFDKLAAYGDIGNPGMGMAFRWLVDLNNDGVPDISVTDPANINGLPVAGNFDGNLNDGDEVGVFDGQTWWLDTNGDFQVDTNVNSTIRGLPIVGDFDGDGLDDLSTYNEQEDRFEFDLAINGFGSTDQLVYFGFAGVRERPVAADMNQDGADDIGLWTPDRSGVAPAETADWYFLLSEESIEGGASLLSRVTADPDSGLPTIQFTPDPFASDLFAQFGDEFALPVVGNFDPPVGDVPAFSMTNAANPLDVNDDSFVAPLDALVIINMLGDEAAIQAAVDGGMYPDVNEDGHVSPVDIVMIINHLARPEPVPAPLSAGTSFGNDLVRTSDDGGAVDESVSGAESNHVVTRTVPWTMPGRDETSDETRASRTRQSPMDEILDDLAEEVVRFWS